MYHPQLTFIATKLGKALQITSKSWRVAVHTRFCLRLHANVRRKCEFQSHLTDRSPIHYHCLHPATVRTNTMAPGFDTLSDHDFQEEEDEIDFSDLQEKYEVRIEEGLDTFVVCNQLIFKLHPATLTLAGR